MKVIHILLAAALSFTLSLVNAQEQLKVLCSSEVLYQPEPPVIVTQPQSTINGCHGYEVIISIEVTGDGPMSYDWQLFGNSLGAPDTNVLILSNIAPPDAGMYRCIVSNFCGSDTSTNAMLNVNPVPPLSLGGSINANTGDTVLLNIGMGWNSILWSTGSQGTTLHVTESGTYYVTAYTLEGCMATDTVIITFESLSFCEAYFFFEEDNGLSTIFFNESSGDFNSAFWNFGDGSFLNTTESHFFHTFPAPGFYTICLTVIDTAGTCFDEYCETIEIQTTVVDCNADFFYINPTGTTINFDASISAGDLTNYYWRFGDGTSSVLPTPSRTYSAAGYYNVTLTVNDTINGCISSRTKLVATGDNITDCESYFTYHSDLGQNKVRFTNASVGDNLDTYLWNFGDGNFAYTANVEHTYLTAAYYNVCLSVLSSTNGCANITCRTIKVGNDERSCNASFVYVVDSTYNKSFSGRKVDFKGAAFGDPAKSTWDILWNFGDGNTNTTTLNPSHIYADTGLYKVSLQISSAYCTDLYFSLVNAGSWLNHIRGGFMYVLDTANFDKANQFPADFKGAAFGDPATVNWDFGDGEVDSTTYTPTHIYEAPGDYLVCFTVADPNTGQTHTSCDSLFIDDIVIAKSHETGLMVAEIYPNPVSHTAIIGLYLPQKESISVVVMDVFGRQVENLLSKSDVSGNHTLFWNTASLQQGIYFVVFRSDSGQVTKRVIVSR